MGWSIQKGAKAGEVDGLHQGENRALSHAHQETTDISNSLVTPIRRTISSQPLWKLKVGKRQNRGSAQVAMGTIKKGDEKN